MRPIPLPADATGSDTYAHARSRFMTAQLPWFMVPWVALALAWALVQLAAGSLGLVGAAAYPAVVVLVLVATLAACRRRPEARRVPWLILGACLMLGAASATALVRAGGFAEVLAFSLSLLTLASSLWLAWGGRTAALLAAGAFGIWWTAQPSLRSFVSPSELAIGFGVAVAMTIAMAEAAARSFRQFWEQRQTERLASHELALARDAYRDAFERVRRRETQLRRLARHQSMIREEERKRLGVDLHDGVCQEIVGVGIHVEVLQAKLAASDTILAADLGRIVDQLRELNDHLRVLSHDLRPMVLLDLGLEESLRSLAAGLSSPATAVDAVIEGPLPALDETAALGVYRIAQEALTNAVRHAAARTVVLRLDVRREAFHLEVVDDGRGFDVAACEHAETIGLVSMEERAHALGGQLDVRSIPGRGTTVRLTAPVATVAPASAA